MKDWQIRFLTFLGLDGYVAAELRPLRAELDSQKKQIEDLRRLLTVQEKPKVRAVAASFREVRQFVGSEDD